MARRYVCLYCNNISRKYKQICDKCGRYMGVVEPKMSIFGILMVVFIIMALVMFAMPWFPMTSDLIGDTIGGMIFCLPLPTIIIALVFNILDDRKKDDAALAIARKSWSAGQTQQFGPPQRQVQPPHPMPQARPTQQPRQYRQQVQRPGTQPTKPRKVSAPLQKVQQPKTTQPKPKKPSIPPKNTQPPPPPPPPPPPEE